MYDRLGLSPRSPFPRAQGRLKGPCREVYLPGPAHKVSHMHTYERPALSYPALTYSIDVFMTFYSVCLMDSLCLGT